MLHVVLDLTQQEARELQEIAKAEADDSWMNEVALSLHAKIIKAIGEAEYGNKQAGKND